MISAGSQGDSLLSEQQSNSKQIQDKRVSTTHIQRTVPACIAGVHDDKELKDACQVSIQRLQCPRP